METFDPTGMCVTFALFLALSVRVAKVEEFECLTKYRVKTMR